MLVTATAETSSTVLELVTAAAAAAAPSSSLLVAASMEKRESLDVAGSRSPENEKDVR